MRSLTRHRLNPDAATVSFDNTMSIDVAQSTSDNAYQEEWQRFRIPARRGFEHLGKGVEAFGKAKAIVDGIAQVK